MMIKKLTNVLVLSMMAMARLRLTGASKRTVTMNAMVLSDSDKGSCSQDDTDMVRTYMIEAENCVADLNGITILPPKSRRRRDLERTEEQAEGEALSISSSSSSAAHEHELERKLQNICVSCCTMPYCETIYYWCVCDRRGLRRGDAGAGDADINYADEARVITVKEQEEQQQQQRERQLAHEEYTTASLEQDWTTCWTNQERAKLADHISESCGVVMEQSWTYVHAEIY